MQRKFLLLCVPLLALSACGPTITDTSNRAANTVEDNVSATWDEARGLLDISRKKPAQPDPKSQPRYCYKFLQDVVCYARPVAGEEDRLVGWQDSRGHAGYVLPPSYKPDNPELPPLQKVTINSTPPIAAAKQQPYKEIIFDPAELQPKELVPEKAE